LEIKRFEAAKAGLSEDVQKKLEAIGGSFFDLLRKRPELENTVDILLCRNFIHFFHTGTKLTETLEIFKKILKPGAIAMFTVNSIYNTNINKKSFEANPGGVSFKITQLMVHDYNQRDILPVSVAFSESIPCTEDEMRDIDFNSYE